ncbi:hypothetical protein M0P48_04345 [Candidatus Gracilibacteria bacterium]|nr:hypothetical protein [Candidatus Gracilibacteria bacterium]
MVEDLENFERDEVVQLAVTNIERRKKNNSVSLQAQQNEDAVYRSKIEKFCENPKTYAEFVAEYLFKNRDALVKAYHEFYHVSRRKTGEKYVDVVPFIMDRYVYPQVAPKVKFKGAIACGKNSENVSVENNELYAFVRGELSLLIERARGEVKLFSELNWTAYYQLDGQKHGVCGVRDLFFLKLCLVHSGLDSDKISLFDFVKKFESVCNRIQEESRIVSYSGPSMSRRIENLDFSKVGGEIFNDMMVRNGNVVPAVESGRSFEEIGRVVDGMIQQCTGIKRPRFVEEKGNDVDIYDQFNFKNFEKLLSALRIFMIQYGLKNNVNSVLKGTSEGSSLTKEQADARFFAEVDGKFFNSQLLETLKKEYDGLFNSGKRRKAVTASENEDIKNFYVFLKYIVDQFRTGQIYMKIGDVEQKKRGEIAVEISKIYAEVINKVAVNLEVKLTTGDFKIEDFTGSMDRLSGLLSSDGLKRAILSAAEGYARLNDISDAEKTLPECH